MFHDIFVKVKLEETRTSTILNVFGNRWSSDVTWSIFCLNFCKMVTSMFQLDLMNLFVKAWAWFNPIIQGMAILIANTSTIFHKDERLGNTYAMHGKCNYENEMLEGTYFHALGTMFNHFVFKWNGFIIPTWLAHGTEHMQLRMQREFSCFLFLFLFCGGKCKDHAWKQKVCSL